MARAFVKTNLFQCEVLAAIGTNANISDPNSVLA